MTIWSPKTLCLVLPAIFRWLCVQSDLLQQDERTCQILMHLNFWMTAHFASVLAFLNVLVFQYPTRHCRRGSVVAWMTDLHDHEWPERECCAGSAGRKFVSGCRYQLHGKMALQHESDIQCKMSESFLWPLQCCPRFHDTAEAAHLHAIILSLHASLFCSQGLQF